MAKVIKQFFGQADHENIPRTWKVGDVIPAGSDLERVAIEQGFCKKNWLTATSRSVLRR